MKKDLIKKVTQFNLKPTRVYYYQVGTRTFSLSAPSEFTPEEVKAIVEELATKVIDAPYTESNSDYAYRIINNATVAPRNLGLEIDLDGIEEEAKAFEEEVELILNEDEDIQD